MSKQDKDFADTGDVAELATKTAAMPESNNGEELPLSASQPEQDAAKSEQSLQFNSWLDRTLPRLMQYLSDGTTAAVTSLSDKAKH